MYVHQVPPSQDSQGVTSEPTEWLCQRLDFTACTPHAVCTFAPGVFPLVLSPLQGPVTAACDCVVRLCHTDPDFLLSVAQPLVLRPVLAASLPPVCPLTAR